MKGTQRAAEPQSRNYSTTRSSLHVDFTTKRDDQTLNSKRKILTDNNSQPRMGEPRGRMHYVEGYIHVHIKETTPTNPYAKTSPAPPHAFPHAHHSMLLFRLSGNLLQPQLIDHHIPTQHDPAPAEPPHLAAMRRRHRLLRGAHLRRAGEEQQRARVVSHLLLAQRHNAHTREGVEDGRVFADEVDGRQRVEIDRAAPARPVVHERHDKLARAVEERGVIGVGGHAPGVEGE